MSKEPKKRIQIHYETDTQIEELMNEFMMKSLYFSGFQRIEIKEIETIMKDESIQNRLSY